MLPLLQIRQCTVEQMNALVEAMMHHRRYFERTLARERLYWQTNPLLLMDSVFHYRKGPLRFNDDMQNNRWLEPYSGETLGCVSDFDFTNV